MSAGTTLPEEEQGRRDGELMEMADLFDDIIEDPEREGLKQTVAVEYIKKNPLVGVGCGVTVYYLLKAFKFGTAMRARDMNNALKGRILAQAATISVVVGAMWAYSTNSYFNQIAPDMITDVELKGSAGNASPS